MRVDNKCSPSTDDYQVQNGYIDVSYVDTDGQYVTPVAKPRPTSNDEYNQLKRTQHADESTSSFVYADDTLVAEYRRKYSGSNNFSSFCYANDLGRYNDELGPYSDENRIAYLDRIKKADVVV